MVYKTGAWGEQAKARSKERLEYFKKYRRKKYPPKPRPPKKPKPEPKSFFKDESELRPSVRKPESRTRYDKKNRRPYYYKRCRYCGTKGWLSHRGNYCSKVCQFKDNNPARAKQSNHGLSKTDYAKAHWAVVKKYGKANKCVNGCVGKENFHWANINGNYWDTEDYMEMCVSCHDKFDRAKQCLKVLVAISLVSGSNNNAVV